MDIKSKINKFSCTFLDENLEIEYENSEWTKDRKKILVKISFFILFSILGFITSYGIHLKNLSSETYPQLNRLGTYWILSAHIINIILCLLTIFTSDKLKKKYANNLFVFMFCSAFLAINVKSFTGLDSEFTPGTMNLFFFPAYPLCISIAILYIANAKFNYTFIAYLVSTIPALLLFIIKGNGPFLEAIFFIILPSSWLVYNVYQEQIKSRYTFYHENLLNKGLRKYFGDTLTDQLIKDEGHINGQTQWVTITFTDMKNYSTIIEKMSPKIAVDFLNEYYTVIHNVIIRYNGMVLNYVGDSVMVIYGAPKTTENHEEQAVLAAIDIRKELSKLNDKWEKDGFSRYWKNRGINYVDCRTGIHCGNLIVGNIGSDKLIQYSAIGDVVNIAARLETINKEFETNIAISEEVRTALNQQLISQTNLVGELNLKGRTEKTNVYSI